MVEPYYSDDRATLYHGDCLDVLADLPDCSVDAVVTDPPYGLRFMGAAWDGADIVSATRTRQAQAAMPDDGKAGANGGYRSASTEAGRYDLSANAAFGLWCETWAQECLRVLKPGGHLVSFGGSRTWHRLAAGIEDAGFEIRDSIAWLYGSGFPKSLDVSKAIDRHLGAEREVVGPPTKGGSGQGAVLGNITRPPATAPATAWDGWGTALKPSFEPIVVARKPLAGTVAASVLVYGTGALNIDACRVGDEVRHADYTSLAPASGNRLGAAGTQEARRGTQGDPKKYVGRWPANVLLDESQSEALDTQSGTLTSGTMRAGTERQPRAGGTIYGADARTFTLADTYGASRFFPIFRYEAKAPSSERPSVDGVSHPTVKPLALMRWLVRLITPPGGVVLEPFAGSGTTLEAALIEGFACIGIEREADYLPLILSRITKPLEQTLDFESEAS